MHWAHVVAVWRIGLFALKLYSSVSRERCPPVYGSYLEETGRVIAKLFDHKLLTYRVTFTLSLPRGLLEFEAPQPRESSGVLGGLLNPIIMCLLSSFLQYTGTRTTRPCMCPLIHTQVCTITNEEYPMVKPHTMVQTTANRRTVGLILVHEGETVV